jgi:uncharacterized delta-60 repeat protein
LVGLVVVTARPAVATHAGTLDSSFGGDGMVTTEIFGAYDDYAEDIAIQPDGKIVAAGSSGGPASRYNFALTRYNPDGSLDTPFGSAGRLLTDFGGDDDIAHAVALQRDGKIVVVGSAVLGGRRSDFAIARYHADGSLDSTFAGNGKQATDFGARDTARGVAIQPDGKIVVVGSRDPLDDCSADFAVARYSTNGTLDKSFSYDGKLTTGLGCDDFAHDVAIQADGKIVVVGTRYEDDDSCFACKDLDLALARYNADGTLDRNFDGDGKMTRGLGNDEGLSSVAIQPDGKIVVAGGDDRFLLARFTWNGSWDSTFAGGAEVYSFGGDESRANDLAIQPDGKIVAAGWVRWSSGSAFALARINPNGVLDTSFSGDGQRITHFGTRTYDFANAVKIQRDGKIVAAGTTWPSDSDDPDFALARLHAAGH